MTRKFLFGLLAVLIIGSGIAMAQGTNGVISGVIQDQSGASVPGATVEVHNVDTGLTRTAMGDAAGRYRIPELSLGKYSVKVSATGFQTEIRNGITLTVGQEAVLDISLTVGSVSQTVQVTEEAPLVEVTSATISYLVNETQVRDLPLNGRDYVQLATLEPNVIPSTNYQKGTSSGNGTNLIIQGQRSTTNLFLVDGTEANDYVSKTPGGVVGGSLGVDAIREFSLLSGNYSAEYGHFMGGILNVVTRSGTNTFHGSAFEFLRNAKLDAKNYLDPANAPIPQFQRNQFGTTFGGPIKKDKAFMFFAYEGLREVKGLTGVSTVLSRAVHAGCVPKVTADPNAGVTDPQCSSFPGINRFFAIPASVKPLVDAMPLGDPALDSAADGSGRYVGNPIRRGWENYYMGRVDYQLTSTNSLFSRYTYDGSRIVQPELLPIFSNGASGANQYATITDTALIGARKVNVFTIGFSRSATGTTHTDIFQFPAGYTFVSNVEHVGIWSISTPSIMIGACPGCRREDFRTYHYTTFEFDDKFSYQVGAHSLNVGGTVKRYRFNENLVGGRLGAIVFNDPRGLITATANSFTAGLSSTLQPGLPDGDRAVRSTLIGLFVQDDYHIFSNLTMNLGLRWEMATSPYEIHGKVTTLVNPLTDTTLSHPSTYYQTTKNNFAPRFGFAWDPFSKGKTSIRGGASMFYNILTPTELELGVPISTQPPFVQTVTLTSNILLPRPLENPTLVLPSIKPNLSYYPAIAKTPTRYFWTLGIQQELLGHNMFAVTYTGSRSVHLQLSPGDMNVNQASVDANGRYFYTAKVTRANPNFGSITERSFRGSSTYHALSATFAKRLTHGVQGQFSYTFAKNLDDGSILFGGAEASNGSAAQYVFDMRPEHGLSTFDIQHSLIGNVLWDLPFGTHTGFKQKAIDGWQLSGIFTQTSGLPYTPTVGFSRSLGAFSGAGADRPDLIPGFNPNPISGVSAGCLNPDGTVAVKAGTPLHTPSLWFDPCAFALPALGYFGNLGRDTIRGPGRVSLDMSVKKNFKVTESTNLEFRGEFFNIPNHPNLGTVSTSLFTTSGGRQTNAGKVNTDTATSSRQIQFALKLTF
jgi:hypothetical protein